MVRRMTSRRHRPVTLCILVWAYHRYGKRESDAAASRYNACVHIPGVAKVYCWGCPRISSTRFTFPSFPPDEMDLSVLVPMRISVWLVS